jgi:hypothetical protein
MAKTASKIRSSASNGRSVKRLGRIGPADNGKRMSLEEFDHAPVMAGYVYELSRGVITVSDVPKPGHFFQVQGARDQFVAYRLAFPKRISAIAAGSEAKMLIWDFDSERHPDVNIYISPPPRFEDPWTHWVPDIAIEVVSTSSRKRDYEQKPDEYLRFGVREYWIIDIQRREMTVLRRSRDKWVKQVIQPGKPYRTKLLPGFVFDLAAVFEAGERYEK